MAVDTLFKNKERAFWVLQFAGWTGYGLLRMFNGLTWGETIDYYKPTAIASITGFCLSLVLHQILRRLRESQLLWIILVTTISCGSLALIFSAIEHWGHDATYQPLDFEDGWIFFGNAMQETYVLLCWSALYFGINYYLITQKQRDRTLAAEATAHQAQLKMLRYQLNPHFLFNTLNAISTLVMMKESKLANDMLKKLSSFLRYTLVNQANQRTPLSQELEALQLYLDIEKVRFEDRLTILWEVDEDAKVGKMPSLLLQPLIENAIKYAIAPMEDGGTIIIRGRVDGDRLIMQVCDDGPGVDTFEPSLDENSSGVGISNTRARLRQLYGDDHGFRLVNRQNQGVEITIDIPLETDS